MFLFLKKKNSKSGTIYGCCCCFKVNFFCDYDVVIMQAQRAAPPDMLCRDKFLIQSTIVPSGMTEEDITASMVSSCGYNQLSFFRFLNVLSFFSF